jgi:putative nucleotidyltransferase with HDIG domain
MRIPTETECYQLMCEMEMLDHIVLHSMQVCRVAGWLVGQLNGRYLRLNPELIRAAALLHDITKTRSFKTQENHAETGGQFLAQKGYPEIGNLVRQHVRLDHYSEPVVLGAAEIINYADKRVLHDRVVSLNDRLDYILERYGRLPEHQTRILVLWQKTQALESEIFKDLSIDPNDLNNLLNSEDRSPDFRDYQRVCGRKSQA